jgi:hypothetical protein
MVLFVYVDNSNVWIEGGHIQAVRLGLATDPLDAARRRVTPRWAYDFGRLYGLACPPGEQIGRSILFGRSRWTPAWRRSWWRTLTRT